MGKHHHPRSKRSRWLASVGLMLLAGSATADRSQQVFVTAGGGPQPDAAQHNRSYGLDYSFWRYARSPRQHLQLGVSYTRIETDRPTHDRLVAVSVYPQLMFYGRHFDWGQPFLTVRALGPTYLSHKQLGEREQERHSYQTQLGAGFRLRLGPQRHALVSLNWKHYSNANLSDDNDGIDLPFVLSFGMEF